MAVDRIFECRRVHGDVIQETEKEFMSDQAPQERGQTGNPATGHGRGLRKLPGFTVAAVAFVVIVILGVGGIAVANWSQSAKVTIGITAGAAPTTAAPPPTTAPVPTTVPTTPAPTTAPPVGQAGNIVVNPVIAARPSLMNPGSVTCSRAPNDKDYTISWAGDASRYIVSLSASNTNYPAPQSIRVTGKTATFTMAKTQAAYGAYVLRIQPMQGTVAGDAIYKTVNHLEYYSNCDYADPQGKSPLGNISVNGEPLGGTTAGNVLKLSWSSAAKDASYRVSIKAENSSYGAEFTTTALNGSFSFPVKARDAWNNPMPTAPYYGVYKLRIQPMVGDLVGDPVYKYVRYFGYEFSIS
ncbi:hypothetical protein ACFUCV_01160 [Specibacter sp. NPDC057265]|uniref:hypothetical protein n=1 Tax=Specibacter sp. NPDC057265 TaxID=3346075 RepID=UPI0036255BF9